jgi:flagellin-like hook-associated protein FlgL
MKEEAYAMTAQTVTSGQDLTDMYYRDDAGNWVEATGFANAATNDKYYTRAGTPTGDATYVTTKTADTADTMYVVSDKKYDNVGNEIGIASESVDKALDAIASVNTYLRSYATELGNNFTIIETRQNFTEALVDVLETGSDNLVLADMNEESANYLALQTRQQLAINSLSLASQSAQSVLSLF